MTNDQAQAPATKITTPADREIRIERVFDAPRDRVALYTGVVTTSVFHTTEERDGMLASGMEGGLNETYERLDELLARLAG